MESPKSTKLVRYKAFKLPKQTSDETSILEPSAFNFSVTSEWQVN
ncbi:hypothetical protein F383_34933 [Gossypium arboreum]|uniref:Uncharacterized protein n=1 Tax=Gossypium arboreum TaxID=29729 RepID=A0A0B0NAI3_GOSAR|nr:hypothetical protein F383_34933 [Gossypium arboreum]